MEGPIMSIEDIRFGLAPLVHDTIEVDGATYVKVIQGEHGRIYYDGMDWLQEWNEGKDFSGIRLQRVWRCNCQTQV